MKRSTVLAGLALTLLGGYIYLYEREPRVEEEGEPVFEVDREDVVRIAIDERDSEPVVLEKRDGAWQLTAPLSAPADEDEVALLLDNLETMRFERSVAKADEVELENFGLDSPIVSVSYRTGAGEEGALRFGADTPTSGNRYAVREGDEAILVLGSYLSLNFEKSAWDLRDKAIFEVPEDAVVERIVVTRAEDELVIARADEDDYRIESPFAARGDRFEAESLARAIRRAEMQELVDEDESDAYFDTVVAATLTLSEGGPLALEVGARKDFDYFGRSDVRPERFLVEGGLFDDLTAAATHYVAKELFQLAASDVGAIRIGDKTFEKGEREREPIERLVERLTAMSAEDVVVNETVVPVSFITLLSQGESSREETIEVGAPMEGYVLLRRAGEGVVLRVPEASWSEIDDLVSSGLAPDSSPEGAP